ncbi:MAG: YeiH family protein [Dehalococcoidia bacterium]
MQTDKTFRKLSPFPDKIDVRLDMTNFLFTNGPGIVVCVFGGTLAYLMSTISHSGIFDPLLLALIFGILFGNLPGNQKWHTEGTKFIGKYLLEISILLLGGSISMTYLVTGGISLSLLIILGVTLGLLVAIVIGTYILKLDHRLAILIGVSNSICGNAAAIAIAPIVKASPSQLATVLGISSVIGASQIIILPLLSPIVGLNDYQYGIVAGMTVYAVAQVYAASASVSTVSASVATLVKLSRVILLVPVLIISQLFVNFRETKTTELQKTQLTKYLSVLNNVPWFILGFVFLSILNTTGFINQEQSEFLRFACHYLFIIAMVGIGTNVDLAEIVKLGSKVAVTALAVIGFMLILSLAMSLLVLKG